MLGCGACDSAFGGEVFQHFGLLAGPIEEGERATKPLRGYGALVEDRITTFPYLQIQSAGDSIFPRGRRYYWKAQFLRELTTAAVDTLLAAYATAPSAKSLLVLQQVGGMIARVPKSATPYVNRDALYDCFPVAIWDDPADDEPNIAWARQLWNAIRPFSTGGVYANNLGDEGEDRVQAAYGENYPRLVALKNKYDPDERLPPQSEHSPKRHERICSTCLDSRDRLHQPTHDPHRATSCRNEQSVPNLNLRAGPLE